MHIKTDRKINHIIKLNEEEAQMIAGAVERMLERWEKDFNQKEVDLYVTSPSSNKNKRVRIRKEDLVTISQHLNYTIEGL